MVEALRCVLHPRPQSNLANDSDVPWVAREEYWGGRVCAGVGRDVEQVDEHNFCFG